jgi:hypothetical protein
MKKLQKYLRTLIATGSILGFVAGWGLLAHSGKPAPAQPVIAAPAPLVQLTPLPPIGSAPAGLQPLPALPPLSSMPRMRLRTGGS